MSQTRVLVVDDDRAIGKLLTGLLSRAGFSVAVAEGVLAAAECAREAPPDVILLDLFLGETRGTELIPFLRRDSIRCPVVVMTGSPAVLQDLRQDWPEVRQLVRKPFDTSGVLEGLRTLVRQRSRGRKAASGLRD